MIGGVHGIFGSFFGFQVTESAESDGASAFYGIKKAFSVLEQINFEFSEI